LIHATPVASRFASALATARDELVAAHRSPLTTPVDRSIALGHIYGAASGIQRALSLRTGPSDLRLPDATLIAPATAATLTRFASEEIVRADEDLPVRSGAVDAAIGDAVARLDVALLALAESLALSA
jgi:hypothetical protein